MATIERFDVKIWRKKNMKQFEGQVKKHRSGVNTEDAVFEAWVSTKDIVDTMHGVMQYTTGKTPHQQAK